MINWKVRLKNKNFWLSLIPAVLLLIQVVAAPFGYKWDFGVLGQQLTAIVNAAFAVMTTVRVVPDPTTKGVSCTNQAMTYNDLKKKEG